MPYTGERWGYCLRHGWCTLTSLNACEQCLTQEDNDEIQSVLSE